jgi:hypothetical protein
VQSAADAAALAAAEDLFLNWNTNAGLDPSGTAQAAAQASAAANGFPNPTVNIPPLSGPFTGLPGYAEVIITYSQQRYFSRVFGSAPITIQARAVAEAGYKAAKVGILVLNPTAPGAVTDTGGGTVTISGSAPLIVDSSDPAAVTVTGGGTVTATEIDVTGTPGISGTVNAPVNSGQPPTPDPLVYLPPPDTSTMPVYNAVHLSSGTLTINPGVYQGGISVSGGSSTNPTILIMNPGIYVMQGGGFTLKGWGTLTAIGVMIYNAPQSNSDVINFAGNGAFTLSPPTTGIYAGISLFQDRSSTNTVSVSGNGGSSMTGTFYVAGGTLSVTGGGTNSIIGSQYISNNLVVNGNGAFTVNWDPNQVAKTRVLRLVE